MRAKTTNFERGQDPKRAMGIGLEAQMLEYFKDKEVYGLMDYLDEIPEIRNKYRNEDATYDDAWYEDIPMRVLKGRGITLDVLHLVHENTDRYEGWLDYDEGPGTSNKMSCGGGA